MHRKIHHKPEVYHQDHVAQVCEECEEGIAVGIDEVGYDC